MPENREKGRERESERMGVQGLGREKECKAFYAARARCNGAMNHRREISDDSAAHL